MEGRREERGGREEGKGRGEREVGRREGGGGEIKEGRGEREGGGEGKERGQVDSGVNKLQVFFSDSSENSGDEADNTKNGNALPSLPFFFPFWLFPSFNLYQAGG
jgi:hypothetical protein